MMQSTKIMNHISELEHKHTNLENKINFMVKSHTDSTEITNLKKMKLKVKEEIEFYKSKL